MRVHETNCYKVVLDNPYIEKDLIVDREHFTFDHDIYLHIFKKVYSFPDGRMIIE